MEYRSIYLVVALAEKGDLRQNMLTMTERWARDVLAVPILRVLEVFHKKVSLETIYFYGTGVREILISPLLLYFSS